MVVQWDGKVLPDIVGKSKVERIAILVSYNADSKFLGAPKLLSSTGENIAKAVYEILSKWNILDRIQGMSFDTTSTNTGYKTGASIHLQRMIESKLISLPCRHHIFEIYLRSVFDVYFKTTQAPDVLIFQRFAKAWPHINKSSFKSGLENKRIRSQISDEICDNIKQFRHLKLKKTYSRADYDEFLTLAFLGDNISQFRAPGATSHARWMAKGIYCLKIFMFRDQFNLSKTELNSLSHVCVFLVCLYVKAWFKCTNAITAPLPDLNFLKDAFNYNAINPTVSKELFGKMEQHLWYLSEKSVAMSFFDFNVP